MSGVDSRISCNASGPDAASSDDFQIGFGPDQHAQPGKQDRVIVGNGDANNFHENSLGGKAATSDSLAFDASAIDILNRIVGNLDKNLLTMAS